MNPAVLRYTAAAGHRRFVALLFVLLLLGMQHQLQVHWLQHAGGLLQARQDTGAQTPAVDAQCVECVLLASGASGIAAGDDAPVALAAASLYPCFEPSSRSVAAPSYYSSRAPPSLL